MLYTTYQIPLVTALCIVLAVFPAAAQDPPPPAEAQLLETLQSEADYTTHMTAFRALRQVGTADAVPVIAGFLHDPKRSHLARFALEDMPYPEAGAALRNALDGAPVEVLPGLLATLGARADASAVSLITPLINHGDTAVAHAATAALGRIASPESIAALTEAYNAGGGARLDVSEALLTSAQALATGENRKQAAQIYRTLRAESNPEFVRVAAFMGLAKAAPEKTPERVLEALQGNDPLYRNLARELIAETKGKKATQQYIEALPGLSDSVQVNLLDGLARRGDKSAREAVLALSSDENADVRAAAVAALGSLGNADDVPLLASLLLDEHEAVAGAARNSLIRMSGPAVNARITQTLPDAEPPVRARLLELLDVRIAPQAIPQAKKYLGDDAAPVRLAALQVLLQQGTVDEIEPVLALMKNPQTTEEAALAARTVGAIAGSAGDAALPVIQASLTDDAPADIKRALVDALGKIGGPEALKPVLNYLDSPDESLRKTALNVLSSWQTQDAAPALLDLARSDDPARHDAGLRGYTRLAQNHPDHDPRNAMMATAMELARTKEEKWMVLSAYGTVHTGPAMDALEAQLDDPDVQREAAMALLKVAEAVGKHGDGGKARAKQSLLLLKEKVPVEYVQKQTEKLLAQLN